MLKHTPSESILRVNLLGGFSVTLNGEPIEHFYSDKVRALLAFMALSGERPVRREVVAELLWPRYRSQSQRVNLRRAIYELKRDVAPFPIVETTHQTIVLSPEARGGGLICDVQELEARIDALGEGMAELGHARAQGRLRKLIHESRAPICHGLSVLGDGEGGFGEWADRITDGLGVRLRGLARRLGELATQAPQGSLPGQIVPIIGRRRELEMLEGRLLPRSHRLLAITGPGGMGKSRLALAASHRVRDNFRDGAWWIDAEYAWGEGRNEAAQCRCWLSDIMLRALGSTAAQGEDPFLALQENLRGRDILVVLDGLDPFLQGPCLEPTCTLLLKLLTENPGLVLIVTSRRDLPLAAASHLSVEGLSYPAEDIRPPQTLKALLERYDAPRLFVERSAAGLLEHGLTDEDIPALVSLCVNLGGTPLALELAAALHGDRSLDELSAESSEDPLTLSAPLLDLPEAHRSIGELLGGTWGGISPQEQQALGHLTQLEGVFTTEAAAQVLGNPALSEEEARGILERLRGRSLVSQIEEDHWRMHILIHRLVVQKLVEAGMEAPPLYKRLKRSADAARARDPFPWIAPTGLSGGKSVPTVWDELGHLLMS